MKPRSLLLPALFLVSVVTLSVALSCSKSNSGSPTLSLESISSPVQVNDSMRAHFKFTGGSIISNGFFWSIRTRQNLAPATDTSGGDTVSFQLPSFSGNSGEISFSLPWQGYLNETATQNDTFIFRFYVKSADSTKISDTVTSPKIIVLYK
jgi:hypothetical protein